MSRFLNELVAANTLVRKLQIRGFSVNHIAVERKGYIITGIFKSQDPPSLDNAKRLSKLFGWIILLLIVANMDLSINLALINF